MSTIDALCDEAKFALQAYGGRSALRVLDEIASLVLDGSTANAANLERLMKIFRAHRAFQQMDYVAEIFQHELTPQMEIYRAQARLDMGQVPSALLGLERLRRNVDDHDVEKEQLHEVYGLIGRAHKQRFVDAIRCNDRAEAEDSLRSAIDSHEQGYRLEVDPGWHGANMAALAWRAEHEKISIEQSASRIGLKLCEVLLAKQKHSPWDKSSLAQGYMAQGDWENGGAHYRAYVDMLRRVRGRAVAFELFGDLRQLREIWLAGAGVSPGSDGVLATVEEMIELMALEPGMQNPGDAKRFGKLLQKMGPRGELELQALVAEGRFVTVRELERVLKNRAAIGKILGVDGAARGSGFLVDGRLFGGKKNEPIFLTNHHVLAKEKTSEEQITPDEARVEFEAWPGCQQQRFAIGQIIWSSSSDKHDVSAALITSCPSDFTAAEIHTKPNPFVVPAPGIRRLGHVHPIGHPNGAPLSLSFAGNEVVDHDLHLGLSGVRRLHYRANTDQGSSGCPVFDPNGKVVAIHRANTSRQITGTPMKHAGTYDANEGIGIASVLAALHT